jgi:hypothetical protein
MIMVYPRKNLTTALVLKEAIMIHRRFPKTMKLCLLSAAALAVTLPGAFAQTSRWAGPEDETAKYMIHMEHLWTDSGCDGNLVEETLLADDFQGTSPEGELYSKQQAVQKTKERKARARDCRTYEVKVHFFGDDVALLYGSESAIEKTATGTDFTRRLRWTDTWLKRNGKWQIVAAQDMLIKAE